MSAADITVIARWQPKEGALGEIMNIIAELRPKSLAEAGCQGYEVYRSIDPPHSLLLIERYRNAAALEAHKQSEHYQSLVVQRVIPLLADRKVELLQAQA